MNTNEEKVNIDIKKTVVQDLEKLESGVFKHPEHGKLLYKPDDEFEIKTCCGNVTSCDKPLMEFLAKTIVSLSVLGFCFIQLSQGRGDSSYLSSTISLILGTYLGSTVTNNNNNKNSKK
tara:strand:+ start:231 stop:587 length:357 start_codon:yes stop_codon:yes gene_type:complete